LVNSYIWRGLECEICQAFYEDTVPHPKTGKDISLLRYDIHPDAEKYIVIESVTNSSSKTIHVINFSESLDIKVGRGSQCEVRITDVSVSRHHSSFELIEHSDDKMYLRVIDENSKFGTLVFVNKPIPLKNGNKVFL
jgi:pSer/pThr/pTyr-binding forkhead associated (FHA) protein